MSCFPLSRWPLDAHPLLLMSLVVDDEQWDLRCLPQPALSSVGCLSIQDTVQRGTEGSVSACVYCVTEVFS